MQRPLVIVGKGMAWYGAEEEVSAFIERTGVPFLAAPRRAAMHCKSAGEDQRGYAGVRCGAHRHRAQERLAATSPARRFCTTEIHFTAKQ